MSLAQTVLLSILFYIYYVVYKQAEICNFVICPINKSNQNRFAFLPYSQE